MPSKSTDAIRESSQFDTTKNKELQLNEDIKCLRQSNGITQEEYDDKNFSCGWSGFRPNCLQRFRTQRWVLFWFCWAIALLGFIVNGCVSVVITTIEKRYKMKSTESGLIASGYDVGSFLLLAPISYFGGTRSKPLFIGVGVLAIGFGCLIFSLPNFTAGRYEFSEEVENICTNHLNETLQFCSNKLGEELSNYKWVFFLGQFLLGAGSTPLLTLGCAYLDESLPTKQSSLYLGIFYSMAVIGPGLGYLLGGQFLELLYVDWLYVDPNDIGLNSSSPVWVGAWYIVFIIGFLLSIILSLPISAFPKELPSTKKIRAEKLSEVHSKHQNNEAVVNKEFGQKAKDLPKSFLILITNPTFMFLNLAGAVEGMVLGAMVPFLPKIVEQQFSISTTSAALIVGFVSIPAAGGGTFLGGYIVKRFDLKCAAIIKFCISGAIVSIFLMMVFFISCPNLNFAGVTNNYPNENTGNLSINSKCNSNCSCSAYQYDPVCGLNNQIFYSPCHAGCQDVHQFEDSKAFSNCECLKGFDESSIINDSLNSSNISIRFEAFRNKCESECKLLPFFLVLIFLAITFTFLISIPALNATMRCVVESQKSFALGIQWMAIRILGTIPAPLLAGFLIDLSCILWQKTCDEGSGACLVYDNKQMMRNILILVIVLKVLSIIFFFFAWFLYKSTKPTKPSINSQNQELNNNSDSNLNSVSQNIDQ